MDMGIILSGNGKTAADMVVSILLFLLIFGVVVFVHEFGHFIVARLNHIKVNEFTIGMGPALFSFRKNDTLYALRLLPIGGACLFEGEDGKFTSEEEDGKKSDEGVQDKAPEDMITDTQLGAHDLPFPKAPVFGRIATVFAGPFFNFILAFVFSCIIIASYGADVPVIQKVVEGGAAEAAGLEDGDRVISLDGRHIYLYRQISLYSMLNRGEEIEIVYEREGKRNTVYVQPQYSKEAGRYYIGLLGAGEYQKFGPLKTAGYGLCEVGYWIDTVIKSLEMLLQGKVSKDDVSGPVGMAQMVSDVYTESKPDGIFYVWLNMISFCVLLSANLGVMNLLPLPALDGGRLIFLFLEVLRGKPIPPEKEGIVHMIGMAALMVLMVFIFFNDMTRLF